MNGTLLYIRYRQIIRELKSLGLYLLPVAGLVLLLIWFSFHLFQQTPAAYYYSTLIVFSCLSLQFMRKDKTFVYQHIERPHQEIFGEYVVLTLPFTLTSLLTSNWYCFPLIILCLWIVPFFRFTLKQQTYLKDLSSIIPASNFEWISGFRKSFMLIVPVYLLALGLSFFRIVPLFLLWFITAQIISFYNEPESLQILREGDKKPVSFLWNKLKTHTGYMLLFYAPVLLLSMLFNPGDWLIDLLFLCSQVSLLGFAICMKYKYYEPDNMSIAGKIVVAIILITSVVPFLFPVPLLMAVYYFGKATSNLKQYLHD